jgi:GNAT superfamily N-acetyltransferase
MQVNQAINFIIQNPCTPSELLQRDSLLSSSLRDHQLDWPYQREYPLVLSETNLQTSWCIFADQKLAAHASLWPRTLTHISGSNSIKIGLVGNVATDPDHRGCGLMSTLFKHLIKKAQEQDIKALILWSDLLEFYQKLGFSSIGREFRFILAPKDKPNLTSIQKVDLSDLNDGDLIRMLQLKPKLEWTIHRSRDEFRSLLGIPNTAIFIRRQGHKITSWLAIGKGSDLQGVIHEWGSASATELLNDVQTVIAAWDLPQLILLAPASLQTQWTNSLKLFSQGFEEHPMALAMPVEPAGSSALIAIARGFFWGFDSI